MSVLQKAKLIIPSSSSSVRFSHLHCFGFKKKRKKILPRVGKDYEVGLWAPLSFRIEHRQQKNRRVTSLSPTPSSCGARVWIRQPAVTADHGSRLPENFSRQSRFIGDFFQVRLMPGVRWRIALWLGDGGSAVAGRGDMTDRGRGARRKGRREDTRPLFDQSYLLEIKSKHCGSISFPPFLSVSQRSLSTLQLCTIMFGHMVHRFSLTGTLKPDFDFSICSMQNPSP